MSFGRTKFLILWKYRICAIEDGINEIMVNKPGEVWIEKKGDQFCKLLPELDFEHLISLGRHV